MRLPGITIAVSLGCVVGCSEDRRPAPDPSRGEMAGVQASIPAIMGTNAFYYYADVDAAWGFYTEILGFSTVADYGFAKILRVGPDSYLTLVDEERGMHSSEEPKSVTLAIITDEVEGWWAYLTGLEVPMRASLNTGEGRPHDGFVAVDPEGYFLEFERFNPHPENGSLLPLLASADAVFPDGRETAPGVQTTRPQALGVRGTVLWLYYGDLAPIEAFYSEALGVEIVVDQGWAKVYPASKTGFLGFVDGERGLHEATPGKAVTVSFFTSGLESWLDHLQDVEGFVLRTSEISSEETPKGDFVRTLVGYDPEGYFLEWDEFVDIDLNRRLLETLESVGNGGVEWP